MKRRRVYELIVGCGAGVTLAFLLTVYPLRYAAGLLLAVACAYAFLRHPIGFLFGLLLLRPTMDRFLVSVRVSAGGLDIGLGGLVALGLTLGAVWRLVVSAADVDRAQRPIVWMSAFLCLVSGFAGWLSPNHGEAAKVVIRYWSIWSVLVLVLLHVKTDEQAQWLLRGMVLSPLLPLAVGGLAWLHDPGGRLAGTFGHPNILAFFLLIVLGCLLFHVDQAGTPRRSWMRIAYLLVLLAALVLTKTRSGWAACVLMALIYGGWCNRRWIIPGLALLAALGMTPVVQEHIRNTIRIYGHQVSVNEFSSLGWRIETWKSLLPHVMERPIFGHGLNADYGMVKEGLAAHNDYLRWLIEAGLVGAAAYFLPYGYALLHAWRHRRRFDPDSVLGKLSGVLVCYIPAFLLMSLTENLASYVTIQWYLWTLIGLYFGLQTTASAPHRALQPAGVPCPA